MIYIKKICRQDLEKEIAFPSNIAIDAFDYNAKDTSLASRKIVMRYSMEDSLECYNECVSLDIHIPQNGRGDEARLSKPMQNFLLKKGVGIGDIIVFVCGLSNSEFDFYCIKKEWPSYELYESILKQKDSARDRHNHKVVTTIQDATNETVSTAIPASSDNVELDARDYAYMAAIKTKPFLILGGFSGTGKSLLVKSLAFATCPCDGVLNTSETSPGN